MLSLCTLLPRDGCRSNLLPHDADDGDNSDNDDDNEDS